MQEISVGQDNISSLFNATAQIVSIFSITLLTGLSVISVYSDTSDSFDESRTDFYVKLRRKRFIQMSWISALNFLTILASLMMIYLSPFQFDYKNILLILVFTLSLASVAAGFSVMLSILNPNKLKKTAEQILWEDKTKLGLTGKKVNDDFFFQDFIRLEQKMKEYIILHKIGMVQGDRRHSFQSFRQMTESLYYNQRIDRECYDMLQQINKYRNLVFHGHIETVDAGMIDKIQKMLKQISSLAKEKVVEANDTKK